MMNPPQPVEDAHAEEVAAEAHPEDVNHQDERGPPNDEVALDDSSSGTNSGKMWLSDQEREWALTIREAIDNDPELDSISDFQCVQLALVVKQDALEDALERAHRLQCFRQQYEIRNTSSDAKMRLPRFLDFFPGYVLTVSYMHDSDSQYCCIDARAFQQAKVTSEGGFCTFISGLYYIYEGLNPDFKSMRNGTNMVFECGGFDFTMISHKISRRLCEEFYATYPINCRQMNFFHSGVFVALLLSQSKRFLPKELSSKFHTGCVFEGGRLDSFYLLPNLEAAQKRVLGRTMECLTERYANDESFRL
ncbi:unknown protein [Seminavis robusta]|uniref:Uncharacterized protein n=1 Tax=Seminavis robusta TaxID=568900 RepID=A0A9N8HEZ2_9STRA|nr:unknown protein [Seminavis robusta]|eukprot:Sro540_g162940.1 n/a (306) ;mRNA; r:10991-11908